MRIETQRLVIRNFQAADAEAAHGLFSDGETMRLVGMYPAFTRLAETAERIERWKETDQHLAITLKETGELLGYIAINPDSEEGRTDTRELGFALMPRFRRKGYMKEAVRAVLDALRQNGVAYVWACCFKENTASEHLIRSMGFEFQLEGTFAAPDKIYQSLEYRITI